MKQLNMLTPRIFQRDVRMACALEQHSLVRCVKITIVISCVPSVPPLYTGTDQEPALETSNA